MSAPAFTSGPWGATFDDGDWYIAGYVGRVPTIVADIEPMISSAMVEANAHLIASAPELYEALTAMLPIVFTGSPTNAKNIAHWEREHELGNGEAQAVLAAYAALAKARGEQ